MFNQGTEVKLGAPEAADRGFVWDEMPMSELLMYYDQIRERLPPVALSEMNLQTEMLLQYHTLRALQTNVIGDTSTPSNQKAQVANSVTASLKSLTELQEGIYTIESYKAVENILIRCLRLLPEEVAAEFLRQYAEVLRRDVK